jgi:hypothetical protein
MFLAASLSAGTVVFLMFLVTVTPLYTKHCFKGKEISSFFFMFFSLIAPKFPPPPHPSNEWEHATG